MDRQARRVAYDVVTLGRELFNGGNQEGCYRLYEGALMALKPMVAHRPETAKVIDDCLGKAKALRTARERAFALREALDAILDGSPARKPLWDRLGGQKAVEAVVHDFVLAAAPDPKVNFLRDGRFALDADGLKALERRLVELVSAVSGGPLKYTGRDMRAAHRGMKITDAEFDALAGHLVATLKKYKVPQAEIDELVGIVASTRKDIVEVGRKPLWDRLGGEKGVRPVVREFLAAAAKDPKVNLDRNGNYPLTRERVERIEQLVVEFVSSVTGGPLKYTGRDMKTSHAGMRITEEEFNAAAGHLVAALKKLGVPQAEIDDLVGLVGSVKKDVVESGK
jgi:hemoglobin